MASERWKTQPWKCPTKIVYEKNREAEPGRLIDPGHPEWSLVPCKTCQLSELPAVSTSFFAVLFTVIRMCDTCLDVFYVMMIDFAQFSDGCLLSLIAFFIIIIII